MSRAAGLAGVVVAVVAPSLLHSAGVAAAEIGSTTTVNGEPPPGVMEPLADIEVRIDSVEDGGRRLLVQEGIRKPGTRAPIQYHDFGGFSCVMSGSMTHFVEGSQPVTHPAGSCYEMQPGVAMTAANLGTEDVRLIDTFLVPQDAPAIIVVEPGWPDLSDPTG